MIQGIFTTLSLISFLAIVAWAFSKNKKKDFEDAGNIPFQDNHDQQGDNHHG